MGIEFTLLVPHKDNDGRTFARSHHERFETRARELFGGWTNVGTTHGCWTDPSGVVYDDTCTRYAVMVPSMLDASKVRGLAEFIAAHYRQKSVYVTCGSFAECFEPNWRSYLGKPELGPECFEVAPPPEAVTWA